MKRREFITLLGGAAAAWPVGVRAQQAPERRRRVAILIGSVESDPSIAPRVMALREGLKLLGWVEGQNLKIDYHWTAGDAERTRLLAGELSAQAPDLIVAHTPPVASALRAATPSIPIVFLQVTDPIGAGLANSLARPGGNLTGFTSFEFAMGTKWLDLLKELSPTLTRVGVMQFSASPTWSGQLQAVENQAPSLGVKIVPVGVQNVVEIEQAIPNIGEVTGSGLIVMPDSLTLIHRKRIVALTERYRLPTIYPFRYFTDDGGLISYGIDLIDIWRRSASYIDRVLKGALPSDLPIQQPTKYELVINLKTAKTLGLTVPPTLLARADEVIE